MKVCPNCGEPIKDGEDVCSNCGALSTDLQNLIDELAVANNKDGKENGESKNVKVEGAGSKEPKPSVNDIIEDKSKQQDSSKVKGKKNKKNKEEPPALDETSNDFKDKIDKFYIPYEEEKQPNSTKKTALIILVAVLLLASLGCGYGYYVAKSNNKSETKVASKEVKKKKSDKKKKQEEKDEKEDKLLEEAKKNEEKKEEQTPSNNNIESSLDNPNDVPNADGTYNDEPAHQYEEDVPAGDARLYWVSDRTLTDAQAQAVANKFGADWTVMYIYAKHGYNVEGYTKYGFVPETSDKALVESRFNGAERRNVKKLRNL